MTSHVPDRYRAVSIAEIPGGLTTEELRAALVGRPAYRRTVYVVARAAERTALVRLAPRDPEPLFAEIVDIEVLAGPDETAFLMRPDLDVAVPSQLARAAAEDAPGARCVVVQGTYEAVSFILDPRPLRVRVLDVAPPYPPKLVDQVRRVLDVGDDLPPIVVDPIVIDLRELAARAPSEHYLMPCRGGGLEVDGADVSYLDRVPPKADWTLLGCARSQAIHEFFYTDAAPLVDMCPKQLAREHLVAEQKVGERDGRRAAEVLLTKCCLRESGVAVEDGVVVVPWGSSLAEIRDGMRLAIQLADAPGDARPAGP